LWESITSRHSVLTWALALLCGVLIATCASWIVDVIYALMLLYGIRLNLTTGCRVAARIDAKRR
jgi:hypothetical protein